MNDQYTFTCSVAVRNLGADLMGDENQMKLPHGFAMRLMMAMLKRDAAELQSLHAEMSAAGWSYIMANDTEGAEAFKLACTYIGTAAHLLAD